MVIISNIILITEFKHDLNGVEGTAGFEHKGLIKVDCGLVVNNFGLSQENVVSGNLKTVIKV